MTRLRKAGFLAAGLVLAACASLFALDRLDKAYPPPLPERLALSTEMVDRDGALLRAFATPDGFWRFKADKATVDQDLVKMLVAYEDRRFYDHHGVDPLAMGRAFLQFVRHGRIVSGGSTITMQVARLIEPREERSLTFKLRQMARALQIERRLSKDEILSLYLTLAPYGGNIEGVRAASLAWYGKEPKKLTLSESALLVALPQSPEMRRPGPQTEKCPGCARPRAAAHGRCRAYPGQRNRPRVRCRHPCRARRSADAGAAPCRQRRSEKSGRAAPSGDAEEERAGGH